MQPHEYFPQPNALRLKPTKIFFKWTQLGSQKYNSTWLTRTYIYLSITQPDSLELQLAIFS